MNMRLGLLLSAGLLFAGIGGAVAAEVVPRDQADAAPPFVGGFLKETRILYPLRHEGWEAQGEHLYDVQALGASVRFVDSKHTDRWIDLYFYPAGVLSPEDFTAAMQHEREVLLAAAQPGASYSDMELGSTQQFDYRTPDGEKGEKTIAYSVDMQMVRDGRLVHSAMTLQLDRLYYVKGRMSTPEHDLSRRAVRRKLEEFVTGLAGKLEITSTGGCWRPMPIEPLVASPGAKVESSLFTLDKDGVTNVIVTRDKVLAADPASPEARLAMMLGMSMTGRLVEGCEPADELDRAVQDGTRELRLEYRAHDPASEGQATPLRTPRTSRG